MTIPAPQFPTDDDQAQALGTQVSEVVEPEWPCDPVETVFARTREGQLSEDEWRQAIERIMANTQPELEARFAGRRGVGGERYFRKASCMLRVVGEDGVVSVHLVATRNLSRGGLSVIHAQELAPGSMCVLALETPMGPGVLREASIEWCRAVDVDGHDQTTAAFELGLRFTESVDVTPFLEER